MSDPNPTTTNLDSSQVIKKVYDSVTERLRVDAEVTASIAGPTEVVISHTDDSIRIGDGADLITGTPVDGKIGLDVNILAGSITGEFHQTGLNVAGKNTTMYVTDTATKLPAVALSLRNSMGVTNLSPTATLYLGFSTAVTADRAVGNNAGWEVGPNEGFQLDIRDNIPLYGIAETGQTILIKIMELA